MQPAVATPGYSDNTIENPNLRNPNLDPHPNLREFRILYRMMCQLIIISPITAAVQVASRYGQVHPTADHDSKPT